MELSPAELILCYSPNNGKVSGRQESDPVLELGNAQAVGGRTDAGGIRLQCFGADEPRILEARGGNDLLKAWAARGCGCCGRTKQGVLEKVPFEQL